MISQNYQNENESPIQYKMTKMKTKARYSTKYRIRTVHVTENGGMPGLRNWPHISCTWEPHTSFPVDKTVKDCCSTWRRPSVVLGGSAQQESAQRDRQTDRQTDTHTHTHTHTHRRTHARTHAHTHIHTRTRTQTQTQTHTHTPVSYTHLTLPTSYAV